MLWRASLSDNPQSFIERARECLQNRVRFPNTLDEVQMLQTLEQSALPAIYSAVSGTANGGVMPRRFPAGSSRLRRKRISLRRIVYWGFTHRNKLHDAQQAKQYLSQAVALEPQNARFLFELDYLNK